jgi:hypothetical protein
LLIVTVVGSPDLEASLFSRHDPDRPPRSRYLEGELAVDEVSLELRDEVEGDDYIEGAMPDVDVSDGSWRPPAAPTIPVAQKFEDANLAPGVMPVMAHAVPLGPDGAAMAMVTPHSPPSPVSKSITLLFSSSSLVEGLSYVQRAHICSLHCSFPFQFHRDCSMCEGGHCTAFSNVQFGAD